MRDEIIANAKPLAKPIAIVNEVDPLLSASCSSIEPQDITASWKDTSQQRSRSLGMQ